MFTQTFVFVNLRKTLEVCVKLYGHAFPEKRKRRREETVVPSRLHF